MRKRFFRTLERKESCNSLGMEGKQKSLPGRGENKEAWDVCEEVQTK